jgi:hypothetical protein
MSVFQDVLLVKGEFSHQLNLKFPRKSYRAIFEEIPRKSKKTHKIPKNCKIDHSVI